MQLNSTEIQKHAWVERYLAGHLDDAQTDQFEAYWARHPELTGDLETVARAKAGLAELRARGALGGLLKSSWWTANLRFVALAACLGLAVVGLRTLGVVRARSELAVSGSPGELTVGQSVPILRLRSAASADATITLPDVRRAIELRVLPEADAASALYSVELVSIDASGAVATAAQLRSLSSDAQGFLTLYLDSARLRPGRYRLSVTQAGATTAEAGRSAGRFELLFLAPNRQS